jgi:tRNA (guanine37-N1)-methyltransferase
MWAATVLTLFPELFPGPLAASLSGKAMQQGIWSLRTVDIRDFGLGRHRSVDDTPFGGGAGMVLRADVVTPAIDAVRNDSPTGCPLIYLSPRGHALTQQRVRALANGPGVILLCGRFEGLDQRVVELRGMEEISVGDFVLSGGEIPAMALIDACVRLLPNVLGSADSAGEESFEQDLLEYPHYTKPRVFEQLEIPPVLISGNHREIADWRRREAEKLTQERRPDLWALYEKRCRSAKTPGSQENTRRAGGKDEPDSDA